MTGNRGKSALNESGKDHRDLPEHPKDKRVEYLTARQLADILQVSESTVHRLRRGGKIPAVELTERLIRFNLRDVQKALRALHAAQPGDDEGVEDDEPTPQLSFDDLFEDFRKPRD